MRITALMILTIAFLTSGCVKEKLHRSSTLVKLYREYKNGEITECKLNGELVYTCGHNAYDAGATIYNTKGEKIGTCNYAWGPVDKICGQLKDCEVIYRLKNNIWGEEPVDKYWLRGTL